MDRINYVHVDTCNGNHEFIEVTMSNNSHEGVVSSWKQCQNCGKFLEGSSTSRWLLIPDSPEKVINDAITTSDTELT